MRAITIPLTKGASMLVNEADVPLLGSQAWQLSTHGYAHRKRWDGEKVIGEFAHRLIMSAKRGEIVDHINRDPLDNRRENLRFVDHSTNLANAGPRVDNTSGYRGVYWHSRAGKWMSQASLHKKLTYLGLFVEKEDAARAYDAALLAHYGPNTGTNFT